MTRAGIGYRTVHRAALLAGEATPAVLEVMPDHFFAQPDALVALAEICPLVMHDVGMSVGTAGPDDADRVARIRGLIDIARPQWFSDHLCLSRGPDGTDLGHLGPLWYTESLLTRVVERVRRWQDALGVPIALENITAPFVIGGADMTEPEFMHALVAATGCGVLLDLTNLWINAQNGGFDAFERLAEYPLDAVVQVHLAGGVAREDWWIDSHTQPVDAQSYAMLAALRGRAPVEFIVIERDDAIPSLPALLAEAAQAARIWHEGGPDGAVQSGA
ncbi:MAG: hypothetical protein ACI9U2_001721 [Bradymonadia bacterium]|jgi:uncharacterized protein (UPF0276 family)